MFSTRHSLREHFLRGEELLDSFGKTIQMALQPRNGRPARSDRRKPMGELPGSHRSVIRIYERFLDSRDRLKRYMDVLLHEMIHSLVSNYCCRCHSCNPSLQDYLGQTGHGVGYIKLAKEAEAFAKRMMNIDLRVGLRECVAIEIYTIQEQWPWEELGLSESNMMKAAERCRRLSASEQTRESASGDQTLDQ